MATSILGLRWGTGVSTPHEDSYYIVRVIGMLERMVTRIDFALMRLKVSIIDRLELDRIAWARLKAQYTPEMS